jgi:DNA repair protein RecN (Recombination protein N)
VAADGLGGEVESQLRALALPKARFEVAFRPSRGEPVGAPEHGSIPLHPSGAERAELRLAANPGEQLAPLAQAASGGELSRVLLALHVVGEAAPTASTDRTLVFDEVDAGVSGSVADAVGARLARLARRHQLLCVTHLPQVAAHADRHFKVSKRVSRGRTLATIDDLTRDRRIEELARMLGGKSTTETSRKHAAELLGEAGRARPRRTP